VKKLSSIEVKQEKVVSGWWSSLEPALYTLESKVDRQKSATLKQMAQVSSSGGSLSSRGGSASSRGGNVSSRCGTLWSPHCSPLSHGWIDRRALP
jgi:hypothetical protein